MSSQCISIDQTLNKISAFIRVHLRSSVDQLKQTWWVIRIIASTPSTIARLASADAAKIKFVAHFLFFHTKQSIIQ